MISEKMARVVLVGMCCLLVQCKVEPTFTSTGELEPFYGTFVGSTATVSKGEKFERDLTVIIMPWENKGFTVNWTTVIYRANGERKKTEPSINFYRSSRTGIFASAMKSNVFGHTVPYDPIGEGANPYVWAGLEDKTLTISALYIIDGGGYEMHVYKRTLEAWGLSLDFERISNGEKVTQVTARLDRVIP